MMAALCQRVHRHHRCHPSLQCGHGLAPDGGDRPKRVKTPMASVRAIRLLLQGRRAILPGLPGGRFGQPQPQELRGLYRPGSGADRGPAAGCCGPRRALHRFRRRRDRQDHRALRLQPAMGDPRHGLDRFPRSRPGGGILHRCQRVADVSHPAAARRLRGGQYPGSEQPEGRKLDQLVGRHRRPSAGGSQRHGGCLFDRHRQPHRHFFDRDLVGRRHQHAAGHQRHCPLGRDTGPHCHPAGRHGLPERPGDLVPGHRCHRLLSHRLRGPGWSTRPWRATTTRPRSARFNRRRRFSGLKPERDLLQLRQQLQLLLVAQLEDRDDCGLDVDDMRPPCARPIMVPITATPRLTPMASTFRRTRQA